MSQNWEGIIISESLKEPSTINEFKVYKARISKRDQLIDENGAKGRWHFYWVTTEDGQAKKLSEHLKKGWYAHFWKGRKLLAVFEGKSFEFQSTDKSTWNEAVDYGRSVGIPDEQLDFPTE